MVKHKMKNRKNLQNLLLHGYELNKFFFVSKLNGIVCVASNQKQFDKCKKRKKTKVLDALMKKKNKKNN